MVPTLELLGAPDQFMAHCLLLLAGITIAITDGFQISGRLLS